MKRVLALILSLLLALGLLAGCGDSAGGATPDSATPDSAPEASAAPTRYESESFAVPLPPGWRAIRVAEDVVTLGKDLGDSEDTTDMKKLWLGVEYSADHELGCDDIAPDVILTDEEPMTFGPYTYQVKSTRQGDLSGWILTAAAGGGRLRVSIQFDVGELSASLDDADIRAIISGITLS